MIKGVSHITFIVKNLEKSTEFFKKIFNAKEVYSSKKTKYSLYPEKFFLIGNIWVVIMEGESHSRRTYNHIAFKVCKKDLETYFNRVKRLGLDIKEERKRIKGEGKSIYFYDYDNHLFEIHTGTLKNRLKNYNKEL